MMPLSIRRTMINAEINDTVIGLHVLAEHCNFVIADYG